MTNNSIIQLGSLAHQITSTRDNPQRYRVYHINGIAPALNCAQGGGLNPYIVVEDRYERNTIKHNARW